MKFKKLFPKMSWDGFFPNLLGVILGILLTFGGNSVWQHIEEKKKTKEVLTLVRQELIANKMWLISKKAIIDEENSVSKFILNAKDKWGMLPAEAIAEDTLKYYYTISTRSSSAELNSTAWNIFQNSEIIQKMPNKKLISQLASIYFWLYKIQENHTAFHGNFKDRAKAGNYELDPHRYFNAVIQNKEDIYLHTMLIEAVENDIIFFEQLEEMFNSAIRLLDKELNIASDK